MNETTIGLTMFDHKDSRPGLPESARDAIGRRLRESLDRIVSEPVPDRFLKLLDDLERSAPSTSPVIDGGSPKHENEHKAGRTPEGAGEEAEA